MWTPLCPLNGVIGRLTGWRNRSPRQSAETRDRRALLERLETRSLCSVGGHELVDGQVYNREALNQTIFGN
jgi:hypothetical protein